MAYTGSSIVDYLKSVGEDSSYTARAKRAEQLGITGYQGTAAQNTQMLNMLRNGQQPTATVVPVQQPVQQQTTVQQSPVVDNAASEKTPRQKLLDTGKYEEYTNAVGNTDIRLKEEYRTTPDTTKTQGAALTALNNLSPERQKTNQLIESLLSSFNTPYNPSTDTSFQAAKGELESAADRAHKNTMAGYLGNQSGNFNSAALQIAAGAQNDILSQIPLLQGEYEDRYNANRSRNLSDTSNMVNMLLGLEDRDIAAKDKEFQKQIDTVGQYYQDYQAEIDRRSAIDPNDPLIPYLKIARAQKIAGMNEAELTAQDKEYKKAFDMWVKLGESTPEIEQILKLQPRTRTADYADMLTDNARMAKSASAAGTSQKQSGGTDFGIALQTMLSSGNPMKWLEENADVFDKDEYKTLYGYAENAGIRPDALFAQATEANKTYYKGLKDAYLNGLNPVGGESIYKDNPQAALNQLRSSTSSRKLLGPLYTVLEEEIIQAIEAKKEEGKNKESSADKALDAWLNQQ
jgi:hypothetical protein